MALFQHYLKSSCAKIGHINKNTIKESLDCTKVNQREHVKVVIIQFLIIWIRRKTQSVAFLTHLLIPIFGKKTSQGQNPDSSFKSKIYQFLTKNPPNKNTAAIAIPTNIDFKIFAIKIIRNNAKISLNENLITFQKINNANNDIKSTIIFTSHCTYKLLNRCIQDTFPNPTLRKNNFWNF